MPSNGNPTNAESYAAFQEKRAQDATSEPPYRRHLREALEKRGRAWGDSWPRGMGDATGTGTRTIFFPRRRGA